MSDEQSLPAAENVQLPKIKELISADIAEHLLFIVKMLGWLPDYRLPIGAVVDAYPQGTTYFFAERLYHIAHNISVIDPDVASEDNMRVLVDKEQGDAEFFGSPITIDPPNSKCLDDALSLTRINKSTYQVAVLIVNIAKFQQNVNGVLMHTVLYLSLFLPIQYAVDFTLKHPNDNNIESNHQRSDIILWKSVHLETDIITCNHMLKLTILLSVMHVNHTHFSATPLKKATVTWLRCKHCMAIASSHAGWVLITLL